MTRVLVALRAAALSVTGASVYGDFFATHGYVLPVVLASVLGAVTGATRWSPVRVLPVGFGAFVVLAAYTAFADTLWRGVPGPDTVLAVVRGAAGGWARMMTVGLPADVRGDLLVTPMLLAWAAAFASTAIASRTRSVLPAVAPPLAAFVVALVQVASHTTGNLGPACLFLVFVLLPVRAPRPSVWVALRRSVLALPTIAAVVALAAAGTVVLPLAGGHDRFDPRDLRPPPIRVDDATTPLALLKKQLRAEEPYRVCTVRVDGDPDAVDRIRTAALERFDGVLWTSADGFLLAGRELAVDPDAGPSAPVSALVTVDRLAGPHLPVLGRPSGVEVVSTPAPRLGFSAGSGVLISTAPVAGLSYRVRGGARAADDGLFYAQPSTTAKYQRHTALPDGVPSAVRGLAQRLAAADPQPYRQLVALQEHLRSLPYSLEAAPGHSWAAVERLLGAEGGDGAYAEQHAAAFAVVARAMGLPSRVAVGYRLHDDVAGEYTVTAYDADAWAEVHFDGYGWVAFHPTDYGRTPESRREQADEVGLEPPRTSRPDAPEAGSPDVDRDGPEGGGLGPLIRRTALITVIVLGGAVLLAALGVVVLKRHRRWRRSRTGTAADRVLGAWHEVVDRLAERRLTVPRSRTAREVALAVASSSSAVARLAPLVSEALYAPTGPAESDVERAWRLEAEVRAELHPKRWSRAAAALSPRPLLADLADRRVR